MVFPVEKMTQGKTTATSQLVQVTTIVIAKQYLLQRPG